MDAEDHLNNNDSGQTEQQCLNNSNKIKDSTVMHELLSTHDYIQNYILLDLILLLASYYLNPESAVV